MSVAFNNPARTEKQVALDKFIVAVERDNTPEARRLWQTGLFDIAETDRHVSTGFTALGYAAYRGYTELARMLVEEAQVDLEATDTWDYTPLLRAAWGDNLDTAQLLIDRDVSLEARNKWGQTAVDLAQYSRSRMETLLREAEQNRVAMAQAAVRAAEGSRKAAHDAVVRQQEQMRLFKPKFTILPK